MPEHLRCKATCRASAANWVYKAQHLENYPWQIAAVGNNSANVVAQLTSRTDANGNVGTDPTQFPYGPYLQQFPTNAYVSNAATANTIEFGTVDPSPGDGTTGWYVNTGLNKFSANDSKVANPNDVLY